MESVNLIFLGDPVPAGRPRFNRYTGRAYDPTKSRDFKKRVGYEAKLQYRNEPIKDKPIEVYIAVYRKNQKNTSQQERARRELKHSVPISKPDTDNYIKSILDALNGVIWDDDNIICHIDAWKFYSETPRVEVVVKEYVGGDSDERG